MCKLISVILSLSLVLALPAVHAAPAADKGAQSVSQSPRRHLANIVFAGLAGAIMGLSTLSFYGRPQDKLSNIAVGFAIGIIGGTLYTTYKAAAEPREFYSAEVVPEPEIWQRTENSQWARRWQTPQASIAFEF